MQEPHMYSWSFLPNSARFSQQMLSWMGRQLADTTYMPSVITKWTPHKQQPLNNKQHEILHKTRLCRVIFLELKATKKTTKDIKRKNIGPLFIWLMINWGFRNLKSCIF